MEGNYNVEFVDGVPVTGVIDGRHAYQLPSATYTNITSGKFASLATWVKEIPPGTERWVFGVCEAHHWMAVNIDWNSKVIQHYDPMHDALRKGLSGRARKILNVITISAI